MRVWDKESTVSARRTDEGEIFRLHAALLTFPHLFKQHSQSEQKLFVRIIFIHVIRNQTSHSQNQRQNKNYFKTEGAELNWNEQNCCRYSLCHFLWFRFHSGLAWNSPLACSWEEMKVAIFGATIVWLDMFVVCFCQQQQPLPRTVSRKATKRFKPAYDVPPSNIIFLCHLSPMMSRTETDSGKANALLSWRLNGW